MSCFLTKPAGETRHFGIDWPLQSGETLSDLLGWFIVPQELDPIGLRAEPAGTGSTRSEVALSGGRPGHIYHIACRVRTSASRVLTRGFLLRVET